MERYIFSSEKDAQEAFAMSKDSYQRGKEEKLASTYQSSKMYQMGIKSGRTEMFHEMIRSIDEMELHDKENGYDKWRWYKGVRNRLRDKFEKK